MYSPSPLPYIFPCKDTNPSHDENAKMIYQYTGGDECIDRRVEKRLGHVHRLESPNARRCDHGDTEAQIASGEGCDASTSFCYCQAVLEMLDRLPWRQIQGNDLV